MVQKSGDQQLRLVVDPVIYRLFTSQQDFFQQQCVHVYPTYFESGRIWYLKDQCTVYTYLHLVEFTIYVGLEVPFWSVLFSDGSNNQSLTIVAIIYDMFNNMDNIHGKLVKVILPILWLTSIYLHEWMIPMV